MLSYNQHKHTNYHTIICQKNRKGDLDLTPFTKMNSKLIVDLNVKTETVKLLEKAQKKILKTFG